MAASSSRLAGMTTRGRCLLAAGIAAGICALVLDERDLLRVAAFVVLLPLLALLLTASSKVGMSVSRSLARPRVPAGDDTSVLIRLRGLGRVPLAGLLVEDEVPAAVAPGGKPRFVLDTLSARGERALRYDLRPSQRGVHTLGPMRVRVSDPFGLAEYDKELPGQVRLVATPRTEVFAGLPNTTSDGAGRGGEAGSDSPGPLRSGHGAEDGSVRQYRHGDDLRRVHWRTTAHRDELMVRSEEQPVRSSATVLLDNRGSAHAGSGADTSLEWAISFAASAYLHLQRHGQRVRLVTDDGMAIAGDGGPGMPAAGVAPGDGEAMLDALAALRPARHRDLGGHGPMRAAKETIAVLGSVDPRSATAFAGSQRGNGHGRAVLLDIASWSGRPADGDAARGAAAALAGAGWAVVLARAGDAPGAVWRALTAQPPGTAAVAGDSQAARAGAR